MILTDREIQIAIEAGSIAIDPAPGGEAYSSTSVDLTLDGALSEYRTGAKGVQKIADPALRDYDHEEVAKELLKEVVIDPTDGWIFKPDRLVLAWTAEYVELKPHARLAGRVEGKSGLARLGIAVHVTAPTIHAGFEGQIRLEMFNHGAIPVRLRAGMRICQLILEQNPRYTSEELQRSVRWTNAHQQEGLALLLHLLGLPCLGQRAGSRRPGKSGRAGQVR